MDSLFLSVASKGLKSFRSKWNHLLQAAIARGLAYAPYADLLWVETSSPDYKEAQEFSEAIHAKYPGKLLAYNCSPSFNWKKHLSDKQIASFQVRGCHKYTLHCPFSKRSFPPTTISILKSIYKHKFSEALSGGSLSQTYITLRQPGKDFVLLVGDVILVGGKSLSQSLLR